MIIYGSRSSHLRSISLENETCPHCGQQGSMVMSTFTRYAHIFWIPLFSVGRFSLSECKHCRQVMEVKQMPPQISAYHHRNLAETRLPLWQFTGLALVAVAIFFGIYANKIDKEEQAQFVANPMSGDVYEMKTSTGAYTTFKLVSVNADSVQIRPNNYEVDRISGIVDIDKDENYSDSTFTMPAGSLQDMFTSGDILDINRY